MNTLLRSVLKIKDHSVRKLSKHYKNIKIAASDIISNTLNSQEIKQVQDWKTVREQMVKADGPLTESNVDLLTMEHCFNTSNYSLGKSYYTFLLKNGLKPNLATIGKYLRLFYYAQKDINFEDEDEILAICKELQEKYPVLDSITTENMLLALSKTSKCDMCLQLLNDIKLVCLPSTLTYSAVICASLKNRRIDMAWILLQEALENGRTPFHEVYCTFAEYFRNYGEGADLQKLLEFFFDYDIKINDTAASAIIEAAKSKQLSADFTEIQPQGVCKTCQNKLHLLKVSSDEFENLKKEFFSKVIIGKNLFTKTNPQEVERFKKFINKMDNFDVVIDGLNVAYMAGAKQSPALISGLVVAVVQHFVRQKKKVLVCGRSHMRKWPKKNLSFIYSNASVFLTEDLSQDDPYLLYCALSCGLNTIIVSRDLMRSHLYLLKNQYYKSLFRRWLAQNLLQIKWIETNGRVQFAPKQPYLMSAQKSDGVWHVPFQTDGDDSVKWMCLKL